MNMKLGDLKFIYIFIFLIFSLPIQSAVVEGKSAEVKILNKITTKVKTIKLDINNSIIFESLNIEMYICYKKPPEEIPEDFVLLKIYDLNNSKVNDLIYQGWMISSSPSVTPFEHPIYDLWIKSCNID